MTIHLQTATKVKRENTWILVSKSRARNHQKKLMTMTESRKIKNESVKKRMTRMTTIKMITTTTRMMMMMMTVL